MATTLQDPTARLLDLPPQRLGSTQGPEPSPTERERRRSWHQVRRSGTSPSFTVYTARGRGCYHTRAQADSAARWVVRETGHPVTVVNERSGERWEVAASARRHR
jgi:hypothetical protein